MCQTITVSPETKEDLKKFGEPGETYDQIIRRLMEDVCQNTADARWNAVLADEEFMPLAEL